MQVGDSTSRGYTLWDVRRISRCTGDEINGVIGACSGRQH